MANAPEDAGDDDASGPGAQPATPQADLVGVVYSQLRAIAHREMQRERVGHTLQATALIHEAYLRLAESGVPWAGPGAFYRAAAEAMRRILIDHARQRGTLKRGGGRRALDLDGVLDLAAADDPQQIMSLDGAISRLEDDDPRAAEVVRLRFYAGLTVDQTAAAMGVSRRTVLRDWEYARAWLVEELENDGE